MTHRSRPLLLAGLVVFTALSQLHCGGCGGNGAGGPPKKYEPPRSVDDVPDVPPAPVVSLSVRAPTGRELGVGWPWLLDAVVLHPGAFGGPSTPPFQMREGAFSLSLVDASGKTVAVSFERLGTPLAAPVTLDRSTRIELSWRLSPGEAGKLAPGRYSLTLGLDLGPVKSRSVPVEVVLAASPDAGTVGAQLAAVDDALARSDFAAAEAQLDAILAGEPDHVAALTRKADLRERRGDLAGALTLLEAAANAAVKAEPNAPEGGPRHLFHRIHLLAAQLDGGHY